MKQGRRAGRSSWLYLKGCASLGFLSHRCHANERLRDTPKSPPLIGYMRVSKADGSQVLDLQRDALIAAGVTERHIYSDAASGTKDERPGLASCLQSLREGDTLVVWK